MTVKNVLLGGKKKQDDVLSDKVTGAYKQWYNYLTLALKSLQFDKLLNGQSCCNIG